MVLATWWYEDGQSGLKLPSDVIVESSVDDETLTLLTGLSPDEICQRRADGNRSYIARVNGAPAAYGWVGTRTCSIGELDLTFTLPAGNRYLWDFGTLPAFRGRGIYPHMLAEILRRECPPAVRLWVIHAPENLPSGIGIARAGFTPVAELSFTDVRVPVANLLGTDGEGFAQLVKKLPQERMSIAVTAVAEAQAAFDNTLRYVQDRKAFGTTIGSFQNTKFVLAEIATEIDVAQAFIDRCIDRLNDGELDPADAAKAKWWTTELQGRIIDRCLQLHGGYGYMTEYPVARAYADARVTRIYGGSTEIMKGVISKSLGL